MINISSVLDVQSTILFIKDLLSDAKNDITPSLSIMRIAPLTSSGKFSREQSSARRCDGIDYKFTLVSTYPMYSEGMSTSLANSTCLFFISHLDKKYLESFTGTDFEFAANLGIMSVIVNT